MHSILNQLYCPKDRGELSFIGRLKYGIPQDGLLKCKHCQSLYRIEDRLVDFMQQDHYSESFGFQWNTFSKTQLDSYSGFNIFQKRFEEVTQFSKSLKSEVGLEVGSGSGAFTEIFAQTGIQLITVDASSAIYANRENNARFENVFFIKADLFQLPIRTKSIHKVFCLGVIQHTPSPSKAIEVLYSKLISGGRMAIDVYLKTWSNLFWSKYWLRPITKRMKKETLLHWIEKFSGILLRAHDLLRWIPVVGTFLAYRIVPITTFKYSYAFTAEQNREWAILVTFDMLSPEFDLPMSKDELEQKIQSLKPSEYQVDYGPNGVIARIQS